MLSNTHLSFTNPTPEDLYEAKLQVIKSPFSTVNTEIRSMRKLSIVEAVYIQKVIHKQQQFYVKFRPLGHTRCPV